MRHRLVTIVLAVCALSVFVPPAAAADAASRCHLLVTVDGPALGIRFRLSHGGALEDWRVRFFRDGDLVYRHVHTTNAEGRLRVVRNYANTRGHETILATARRLDTGAICRVSVFV